MLYVYGAKKIMDVLKERERVQKELNIISSVSYNA